MTKVTPTMNRQHLMEAIKKQNEYIEYLIERLENHRIDYTKQDVYNTSMLDVLASRYKERK